MSVAILGDMMCKLILTKSTILNSHHCVCVMTHGRSIG